MALKATRTIFCSGFDESILSVYSREQIKAELEHKGWVIMGVYIMKSKKSFKIEFGSKKLAEKFLANCTTSIGGIRLNQNNKEKEINPTINEVTRRTLFCELCLYTFLLI